jgi:hypothetical protein
MRLRRLGLLLFYLASNFFITTYGWGLFFLQIFLSLKLLECEWETVTACYNFNKRPILNIKSTVEPESHCFTALVHLHDAAPCGSLRLRLRNTALNMNSLQN